MRDSYESGEIDVIKYMPGVKMLEEALTKRNIATYKTLKKVLVQGYTSH